MKEIIVIAKTDGSVEIEGNGFSGQECDKIMAPIEKVLGKVKSRKDKPEYYNTAKTVENIKIK